MIEEGKMKKTKWLATALLAHTLAVSAAGLAACGHEHTLVKTDAVAATCTEAGSAEYWKCSDCGKIFADAAGGFLRRVRSSGARKFRKNSLLTSRRG